MLNKPSKFDEPSAFSAIFLEDMPAALLLELPKVIRSASGVAWRRDSDLIFGARRDLYPMTRRALVEHSVHELGEKFRDDGVRTTQRLNRTRNHHHVELAVGRIVMIVAAVEADNSLVRDADFRRTLAINPQCGFAELGVEQPVVGDSLLAVLLYGPSSEYPSSPDDVTPGFTVVRFPYEDWSGYAEGRIDLFARLRTYEAQERSRNSGQEVRPEPEGS